MIKVYVEGKISDCNDVLFIEGLVECGRVIEDLAGFGVFGAVDYMCSIIVNITLKVSHTVATIYYYFST